MQDLLKNTIGLCVIARGTISIPVIHDLLLSAPNSIEEIDTTEWRTGSLCWKLLGEGNENSKKRTPWEKCDFDSIAAFWLEEYPFLDPKTRSSIHSTLISMMYIFLRQPFHTFFVQSLDKPSN
jgi:hypothetical protein